MDSASLLSRKLPLWPPLFNILVPPTSTGWYVSYYTSKERDIALKLCGWCPLDQSYSIETLLHRLQQRSLFQRAAALALFHLDITRAIRALVDGSNALSKASSGGQSVSSKHGSDIEEAGGRANDLRMAAIVRIVSGGQHVRVYCSN